MDNNLKTANAIESLKHLLKIVSIDGYSYNDICSETGDGNVWNANSLKQFIHRAGISRKTEKVVNLSSTIIKYIDKNPHLLDGRDDLKQHLYQVNTNILNDANFELSKSIDKTFLELRQQSAALTLPLKLAFARFGRNNKIIITILIELIWNEDGYIFIMKISGSNGQKRVVIGDVSHTIMNTHFTGIAYGVSIQLTDDEFYKLDILDNKSRENYLSSNSIGFETISVSNFDLFKSTFPACFTGLDGLGKPVGGIGVLINEKVLSDFDIDDNIFSAAECCNDNIKLTECLNSHNSQTVYAPQ